MERAGRLVGKMNLPPQVADAETRARAAWPVAAGQKIAKHAKATALVRGTLLVEVGDELVIEIDFRPTPARRPPQAAASARPDAVHTDGIQDPVLALLYRRSQ